jgi:hypothetical protein
MPHGKVMFAPVAKGGLKAGRPAFGQVQPDGSFVLSTYREGDGAVVGDHWVSVANVTVAANPASQLDKTNFKSITFPRRTVAVIADQENRIDIELTSQAIAKYGKRAAPDG